MMILALETATRAGSLAIRTARGIIARTTGDPATTHGVRLPGEALDLLASVGASPADVDRFVVITGPGSFTGLRVGLATVQGLALPGGRLVTGVPTFDAMAAGWLARRAPFPREADPAPAALLACLDGARGDLFYCLWDVTGASGLDEARVLIPPAADEPRRAIEAAIDAAGERPVALTGDVTAPQRSAIESALGGASFDPMPNLAAAAAELAARRPDAAGPPHALRPLYVRRSDAEIARDRFAARATFAIDLAATPGDLADVARVQARAFDKAWAADELRAPLSGVAQSKVYVARLAGEIVAYCACWRVLDELHVNSIAVDPSWRRQGVGRELMRRILDVESADGARQATLEVRESNVAGRALYEAMGFRLEGVRRGYYQDPREDALILWRRWEG